MLSAPFLDVQKPLQNDNYHSFSQAFFPHIPHTPHPSDQPASLFFIPEIPPALCLLESGSETCSPIFSLGCLVNKPSLLQNSASQCFGLLQIGQNKPGLVRLLYITLTTWWNITKIGTNPYYVLPNMMHREGDTVNSMLFMSKNA